MLIPKLVCSHFCFFQNAFRFEVICKKTFSTSLLGRFMYLPHIFSMLVISICNWISFDNKHDFPFLRDWTDLFEVTKENRLWTNLMQKDHRLKFNTFALPLNN